MDFETFRKDSQISIPIYLITVTQNPNIPLLDKVFEAIIKQKFEFKYIVVDNSNSENHSISLKKFIEEKQNKISICYHKEEKSGIVNARIKGLKSLDLEIESLIIFIDDDNIINDNYLENALSFYLKHSRIGLFSGNAIFSNDRINKRRRFIDIEYVLPYLGIRDFAFDDLIYRSSTWNKFEPIGAGLCMTNGVAKEWLRIIESNESLMELGRNGNQLMSGEDSLFNLAANNLNLFSAYVSNLTLKHELNERRFRIWYLTKLFYGYGKSHAIRDRTFNLSRAFKMDDLYSLFQEIAYIFQNKKNNFQFAMRCFEIIGYKRQMHLFGYFQFDLKIFLKKIDSNLRSIRVNSIDDIEQMKSKQMLIDSLKAQNIQLGLMNDVNLQKSHLETKMALIDKERIDLQSKLDLKVRMLDYFNSSILLRKNTYLNINKIIKKETTYTIATGADHQYFEPLYYSVRNYFQNYSFDKSNIQFMIWDLGLSDDELTKLQSLSPNILILKLGFYEKEPFEGAFNPQNDCFAWKPFCVKQSMTISGNSVLWLDAGVLLNRNPIDFINLSLVNSIGAIRNYAHKNVEWISEKCKEVMKVSPEELDAPQIQANMLFFSKNQIGMGIVEEWCAYSSKPGAILGDVKSHRHDQTILSILISRHNIKIVDPLIFETEIFSAIDLTSMDYVFVVHRGNI